MRWNSITFKILFLVVLLFLFTSLIVLFVVDYRLKIITDSSQERGYSEQIELIVSRLKSYQERLAQTGLQEVYLSDFKHLAVSRLRDNYYKQADQKVYPLIISYNGNIVLSKDNKLGEKLYEFLVNSVDTIKDKTGSCYFSYKGIQYWGIYKSFTDWEWYIAYAVPLEFKYAQAESLRNNLAIIMSVAVVLSLVLLILFLMRITKPIGYLTEVAGKIADGELEHEIELRTTDEVGQLANVFDKMRLSIMKQLDELNNEVIERKQTEKNLLVTLNSIGDAVISTDNNGCIVHMNPVALELTGWEFSKAVGKPLLEVFNIINLETKEQCASPVEKVLETGDIVNLAKYTGLISKDGETYRVADSGSPIRNEQGEILGVVLVFRDVTEQYKLEDQLRQSDKMQAVGQLAGGIAHDFNNMLGGIIGATEILKAHLDGSKQASEIYGIIINAADRAAELTQQLLAFSRSKKIASTAVELHTIIQDSVSLLKRTIDKSVKIILKLDAGVEVITGDPAQLQNIIINLSINASHAMPDGGSLIISTRNIFLDDAYCRSSNFDLIVGEYIELEVRDTGCGIPAEYLARIFEPFFTTKKEGKGTGLGLSAVYGSVLQHHGAIKIYSEVGEGTVFNIFFPVSSKEQHLQIPQAQITEPGEGTILVVDDEPIMRATAEAILQDVGYTVLLAENGKKGIEVYLQNQAEIDLIVLDMIMPVMNGKESFARIKEIDPEIKIILASGFSKDEDIERMKKKDLCAFISKPYRSTELAGVVAEVLHGKRHS